MRPAIGILWLLSVVALCSGRTLDPNSNAAAIALMCLMTHTE